MSNQNSPQFANQSILQIVLFILVSSSIFLLSGCNFKPHDSWMSEIDSQISRGDYKKAQEELNTAAFVYPKSYSVDYYIGYLAFAQKDYDRAIKYFQKALAVDPLSSRSYELLGKSYLEKNNYTDALINIDTAAWFYHVQSNKTVVAELDKLANQILVKTTVPEASIAYNNGLKDMDKKNYLEANKAFTKAISLDKDYQAAYYSRGLSYGGLGDMDKAIADLNKVMELNPYLPDIPASLAWCYERKMNFKEAAKNYFLAHHLMQTHGHLKSANEYSNNGFATELFYNGNPNAEKLRLQAEKLRREKKYSEAISVLTKLVKDYPDYAAAYYARGTCYQLSGDYINAEKDYSKAVSMQNWSGDFFYQLGITQLNLNKFSEAYDNFKKAEEIYTANYLYAYSSDSLDNMARSSIKSKDQLAEIQRILTDTGRAYQGKNFKEGIKQSEQLIKLIPDYYLGYALRAEANFNLKNYAACLTDLDKAISLNKYDFNSYVVKGNVYIAQGKISDAKSTLLDAALIAIFSKRDEDGIKILNQAMDLKFTEPKFNLLESLQAAMGVNNANK